jgi:uncharacterized membrane protein YgaE (UPF0421/DUF939 family)
MGVEELGRPLRAAVAATAAWLVVMPLGGAIADYPYYAPLGAVIAVTSSVIGSARETLRTIIAMSLGVGLAVLTWPLPVVWSLLVVVLLGSAVSVTPYLKRLGGSASWTPITGMFVLVIGAQAQSPWDYAGAYVGLVTVGALIGMGLNVVWPPLPLKAEARTVRRVRDEIVEHLDSVAHGLRGEEPPTPEEWDARIRRLEGLVGRMRGVASQAGEARRANWRVRRRRTAAERRYQEARALERLSFLMEDLTDLLSDQEHADRERVALGPDLRPYAADALGALADVLRTVEEAGVDEAAVMRAAASREELVHAMRRVREDTGDDLLTAGGVVTAVNRTLDSLPPARA